MRFYSIIAAPAVVLLSFGLAACKPQPTEPAAPAITYAPPPPAQPAEPIGKWSLFAQKKPDGGQTLFRIDTTTGRVDEFRETPIQIYDDRGQPITVMVRGWTSTPLFADEYARIEPATKPRR